MHFLPHFYCNRFHVKILLWAIFVFKESSFTLQFDISRLSYLTLGSSCKWFSRTFETKTTAEVLWIMQKSNAPIWLIVLAVFQKRNPYFNDLYLNRHLPIVAVNIGKLHFRPWARQNLRMNGAAIYYCRCDCKMSKTPKFVMFFANST